MPKVFFKLCTILLLLASQLPGQVVVVEDTNIFLEDEFAADGEFILTVFETPPFEDPDIVPGFFPPIELFPDPTSVFGEIDVADQVATLTFTSTSLDGGSEWFLTNFGDAFAQDTVEAGQFETLVDFANAGFFGSLTVDVNESFFLGVNTGDRSVFGWGEFLIDENGDLILLDNAVAYNADGIFVGQSVAIPEPSSGLLLLIGASLCLSRRSRRTT